MFVKLGRVGRGRDERSSEHSSEFHFECECVFVFVVVVVVVCLGVCMM